MEQNDKVRTYRDIRSLRCFGHEVKMKIRVARNILHWLSMGRRRTVSLGQNDKLHIK
jgi:hypothetical protein